MIRKDFFKKNACQYGFLNIFFSAPKIRVKNDQDVILLSARNVSNRFRNFDFHRQSIVHFDK